MSDNIDPIPIENVMGSGEATAGDGVLGTPWDRRTFLKAAALGTAAAVMWERGPGLSGPLVAFGNDLSLYPCTANDVTLDGTGQVINEPCNCTTGTTFNAIVAFTVTNHTGTGRYCITLHLPGSTDGTIAAQDVILHQGTNGTSGSSSVPANSTTTLYGVIAGFPCNAGLVCFGTDGTVRGKCSAAGACATVAWSTTPGDAGCTSPDTKPPRGQCRHQNICVQGFGAELTCATDTCAIACGGTIDLTLCVTGGTSPYTFSLSDGTTTDTTPDSVSADGKCATFTVSAAGTYTGTVTDKNGCSRTSGSVVVSSAGITATISVSNNGACTDGLLVFTAGTEEGASGCTFTYQIDFVDAAASETDDLIVRLDTPSTGQLTYRNLDGACHTISVGADCSSCADTASIDITQCVNTSTDACA
jgi:hypothetical protein